MWEKIVRAAALVLLLIAATDVLFVDTAFASACSSNTTSSSTSTNPQPGSGPGDDDCYCCSTHIVLRTASPVLVFSELVEPVSFDLIPAPPSTDPKPILHPPKA